MSRSVNDRRVRKIMAAVARVTATPHLRAGVLDIAFEIMITFGNCSSAFDGDNWTPEAVHAIVLALALNAPPKAFDQLVAAAESARQFIEHWDERGWIEADTLPGDPRRWWESKTQRKTRAA